MRVLLLALLAVPLGCGVDLVGPEDPRCTIHVGEDERAEIDRWQLDNCEQVNIVVVRFE